MQRPEQIVKPHSNESSDYQWINNFIKKEKINITAKEYSELILELAFLTDLAVLYYTPEILGSIQSGYGDLILFRLRLEHINIKGIPSFFRNYVIYLIKVLKRYENIYC